MGSAAEAEMDALGYNRYEARYDEDVLDYGCATLAAKLMVIPEPVMPELNNLRAEIERKRTQVHRQRGEIWQLQRAGISTASAELLLQRMLSKIDELCGQRDVLKKD
jgi:hypothetical protein